MLSFFHTFAQIFQNCPMTNEDLLSKTITWLRFPLAVAIVYVHNVNFDELAVALSGIDYSNLSGSDIYYIVCFLISDVLCRVATPCFCIFSGFLFYYRGKEWNRNIYLQKVKRKTRTLLTPYLLWNIIPVAITAFFAFLKFDDSLSLYMKQLWDNGILKIFWNYHEGTYPHYIPYPLNIPLWFLRDLIVVAFFLSPLVYYFVKYTKVYSLFILGLFYLTNFWFPMLSIRTLFFFTLGAYFSIHGLNMVVELRKSKLFWILASIITLLLSMYFQGSGMYEYIFVLFNISGCITTIIIAAGYIKGGNATIHPFLSKTSFFIFASHTVYLLWFSNLALNFILKSDSALMMTTKYFLAPAICVCVCLALYYAAKKTVPWLLGILTGSR